METSVIVAVISFAGTLVGTAGGILASSKLIEYRLEQLEKKVDIHSKATAEIPVINERLNNITCRVKFLEQYQTLNSEFYEAGQ